MKRIAGGLFLFLFVLGLALCAPGWAQGQKAKADPLDPDGTKWDIEIITVGSRGRTKTHADTLAFEDKHVIAAGYEKKGYEPSNYTLRVTGSGITTFETMQNSKKETAFWNGEIQKEGAIRGSIYVQNSKGNTVEYPFKGKLTEGVLRTKGEKALAVQAPVPVKTAPRAGSTR